MSYPNYYDAPGFMPGSYPTPGGYAYYPAPPPPPGGPWMGGYGSYMDPWASSCLPGPLPPPPPTPWPDSADLYLHGQQYGMTPRQVDEAIVRYRELCERSMRGEATTADDATTDRGLIRRMRLPGLMEFIALIGSNMLLGLF